MLERFLLYFGSKFLNFNQLGDGQVKLALRIGADTGLALNACRRMSG
jgi:hypothetical protein